MCSCRLDSNQQETAYHFYDIDLDEKIKLARYVGGESNATDSMETVLACFASTHAESRVSKNYKYVATIPGMSTMTRRFHTIMQGFMKDTLFDFIIERATG